MNHSVTILRSPRFLSSQGASRAVLGECWGGSRRLPPQHSPLSVRHAAARETLLNSYRGNSCGLLFRRVAINSAHLRARKQIVDTQHLAGAHRRGIVKAVRRGTITIKDRI